MQTNRQISLKNCRGRKKAFTLAEVLVTLAIIGVVAALTIPSLVQNTQKQQYVTGLKKAYSDLSQATLQLMNDNGGTMRNLISFDNSYEFVQKYCTKLNCIKICNGNAINDGCWADTNGLSGTDSTFGETFNNFSGAVLSNGTTIASGWYNHNCTAGTYNISGTNTGCFMGSMYVDTNGLKEPNILGRDVFAFIIHANGIAATGVPGTYHLTIDNNWTWTCNTGAGAFLYANGLGCAGRILLEGDMNY